MECPYCSSRMILKDSSIIYGKSYGNAYVCAKYPTCDTYVGVHKAGRHRGHALGTPANAELRRARRLLHGQFDHMWMSGHAERNAAYAELAKDMGIPVEYCHIAMFDLERCRKAWTCVQNLRKRYLKGA